MAWRPALNAALLWQLRKQKNFTRSQGWLAFLLRLIIAVLVMAAALLGAHASHA